MFLEKIKSTDRNTNSKINYFTNNINNYIMKNTIGETG